MSTGSRHLERCPALAAPASSSTASSRRRTASGRRQPPERDAAAIPPHGGRRSRAGRAPSAPGGGRRLPRAGVRAEPPPDGARTVTAPGRPSPARPRSGPAGCRADGAPGAASQARPSRGEPGGRPSLRGALRASAAAMEEALTPGKVGVQDEAVDKSTFKECNQIAFYRRQKRLHPGKSLYRALLDSVMLSDENVKFHIIHEENKVLLQVEICEIEGNIFRLKIDEATPLRARYKVPDVLTKEPTTQRKPTGENEEAASDSCKGKQEDLGLWQEKFGSFLDVKAHGPSSVGTDFSLHGFDHVYGIPQHTEALLLKNTSDGDAYRLYNLDIFGHKIHDKIGIYGSVPLLLAHKPNRTAGIFWLNSSETLVDISTKAVAEPMSSGSAAEAAKQRVVPLTDVRWMSESGIIDVFLLMGPTAFDIFKQFAQLTGTQALPPLFSLGYHQCRWNYEDEQDVKAVDAGFDEHDIPYDVIWLDIEHTDGKRYFTWDKKKFQNPRKMQEHLRKKKRKLVVIVDPHIKIDPTYTLYSQAKDKGYFVKDRNGQDFEGICWPGSSCYLDFTNPEVRKWYADQFTFKTYKGSTNILFVWNDMNEPSVFKGAELTMQKDAVHYNNWEHREVHNLYGFYQQMATAEGLIRRSSGKERPFVLTRSFFAGSQKYGAVWTGDNTAEWSYLKISIPMLLTISMAGISFCGADVGGFIGDPEPELLVRWYQAGAYQPFFRGHSNMESKRREPWLFGEKNTQIIREAIRERYVLLPYLYTLFYRAHTAAEPVMRPLWVEFPGKTETFGVENEYMLGNALLVHPVTEQEAKAVSVLLPGSEEIWYDFRKFKRMEDSGTLKIPVTLENIPVFQRGGTVIPLKTRAAKSTEWMIDISYELHVALDTEACAIGELYLDDGHSFQYLHKKQFLYQKFTFQKNILSSSRTEESGKYHTTCVVERVIVLGFGQQPTFVTACSKDGKGKEVVFTYNMKTSALTLENLALSVDADWQIYIN
ncbi:neutral alpha-glucosidase C isoform X2 [Falco rusticolus]|uniref:neutral alpha-glucosidase C isoform X2 n=1 Tax=Falco rusticolus TaxID=120794 RepID=UPI00188682F2|nr:neutral alpha-glucosidase C isoform X2 [Falco rusticolus]